MIDFTRSSFTWKGRPHQPDRYYRYPGGFVGTPGQVYQVRFNIESMCLVSDEGGGGAAELFLGADCLSEYTIASENLFQVPNTEFRFAFSRESRLGIARRPSSEREEVSAAKLSDSFQDHKIDLRQFQRAAEIAGARQVVQATLAGDLLNARSTYRDPEHRLTVSVEYPINLINVNEEDGEFQVCTGPVILPDLATWDGRDVRRGFVAHAAFTRFDRVEFVLQREVDASAADREWLDVPRGRDRLELRDPRNRPPGYPPRRPRLIAYNEVWDREGSNVVLRAGNTQRKAGTRATAV